RSRGTCRALWRYVTPRTLRARSWSLPLTSGGRSPPGGVTGSLTPPEVRTCAAAEPRGWLFVVLLGQPEQRLGDRQRGQFHLPGPRAVGGQIGGHILGVGRVRR